MTVSYTQVPGDFLPRQRENFLKQIRIGLAVLLVLIVIGIVFDAINNSVTDIGTIIFSLVFFSIYMVGFYIYSWRRLIAVNQSEFCLHTITLNDQELVEKTDHSESRFLWSSIYQVEETAQSVQIYVSPGVFCTVPIRAFPTREAMHQFYEKASNLEAQAKAVRQ